MKSKYQMAWRTAALHGWAEDDLLWHRSGLGQGRVAWGVGYLIAMPGLGTFKGALGWSSAGQYEAEIAFAEETYEPIYAQFAAMDFADLTQNEEAIALGKSLYASYCTSCHGSDARGAPGYPNLTDGDWLWGNSDPPKSRPRKRIHSC